MLQTVDLGRTSLAGYRGLAPDEIVDELERLGREFATGVTVITVSPEGSAATLRALRRRAEEGSAS